MPRTTSNSQLRGFTLIELILALGLSAVLLALLASALGLGVSRAVGSRDKVQQARLVEGIVALVRGDIHRAIIYDPQDTSGAMELAEASAEFDVDSIDNISSSGGGTGGGSSGGTSISDTSSSGSSTDGSSAQSISLRRPLGVYGTLQELQIDVLREHSQFELDAGGAVVAPTGTSGITTVRYALEQGEPTLGIGSTNRNSQLQAGLTRQEVNRDLLSWASQTGNTAQVAGTPQLIAPEVSNLEFRYFDGVDLVETWDSEVLEGAMPQAIEMRIWFAIKSKEDQAVATQASSLPYVVTIALPGTWNATDADVAGASSTTDDSSTEEER